MYQVIQSELVDTLKCKIQYALVMNHIRVKRVSNMSIKTSQNTFYRVQMQMSLAKWAIGAPRA